MKNESGDMDHILECSYGIHMPREEFQKLLDPNIRKRLKNIIPAFVKDYEIICNGAIEATKKYGLREGEFRVWESHCYIHYGVKFDARDMNDEVILRHVELGFRAVAEVGYKFESWIGFGTKFSPERQVLLDKKAYIPGLRKRVRFDPFSQRCAFLVIDWPPNTGDPKKDQQIYEVVKEYLVNKWRIVFTPEARLKLISGEIVMAKPRRKRGKA